MPALVTAPLSGATLPASDLAFRGILTPEAEFLLLSARTQLSGARRSAWEKLLRGEGQNARAGLSHAKTQRHALDWEIVLHLAQSHRVTGLLGRHLSARAWKDVPPATVQWLQNYFQKATLQSAALKGELARVCAVLESAQIPVVSFKGPTLGLAVYGNNVVRPSSDLDLLVRRDDVLRAREALERAGYEPEVELSQTQMQINLRVDSVFNFFRPAPPALEPLFPRGLAVELHWAITSPCLPFDLNFGSVESRLNWLELPGVPAENARVRALGSEDLLLILCVHGAKHLWERLIWLCDLAQLIESTPDLNWDAVLEGARARGVQRMTALGLILARDVMGAVLPRRVEDWISTQPQTLRLASQLKNTLLEMRVLKEGSVLAGHVLSADKLLLQTIDRPRDRAGFLWHLLTAPTMSERAALNLPPHLDFLWWFLRPARALQKRVVPSNEH